MKEDRDDGACPSLAGLPGSLSLGFLLGLYRAQRDIVRAQSSSRGPRQAGGARRDLAGLPGSSLGLVETH